MNGHDYWKRRALKLEQLLHARADQTVAQISRLYGLAQEEIFRQIERVYDRYAKGGALNEEQAMTLLTVRETREARAELMELYLRATGPAKKELWARLAAPAYANRISRLQALRDRLYAQARLIGLEEVGYVRDRLADTLEQSYYRTTFDIQQGTGYAYDFRRLDDLQIQAALASDWSEKNWSDRIWDNNRLFADAVQDVVTVGIMAGLRYDELRDNLLHVIGMDDDEGARYRSARLIRTECANVANQGHLMGYQAAEIEEYIFLATLDLVTSEVCRELDMKTFPVAEAQTGENLPPMHPNCRSTTMPNMSADVLARIKRAARDPVTGKYMTVPGDMNYREWYAKYVEGNKQAKANEQKVKNKLSDQQQFERYREVLGENAPKTLEEFEDTKYNNHDRWEQLKYQYRTVNRYEVDGDVPAEKILELDNAAFYTKKKGFDYSSLSGRNKREAIKRISNGGNAAAMEFDGGIYFSHSSFGEPGSFEHSLYRGDYPAVTLSNDRTFAVMDLGDGIPREYDTEAKFLEFVAARKQETDTFTVTILSERHICESCQGVVKQFEEKFPNATVNVISGKLGYNGNASGGSTWKHRKKVNPDG